MKKTVPLSNKLSGTSAEAKNWFASRSKAPIAPPSAAPKPLPAAFRPRQGMGQSQPTTSSLAGSSAGGIRGAGKLFCHSPQSHLTQYQLSLRTVALSSLAAIVVCCRHPHQSPGPIQGLPLLINLLPSCLALGRQPQPTPDLLIPVGFAKLVNRLPRPRNPRIQGGDIKPAGSPPNSRNSLLVECKLFVSLMYFLTLKIISSCIVEHSSIV
jgi:hypothetical protein